MNWIKAEMFWRLFFDAVIGVLLVVNGWQCARMRRDRLEIQRYNRDKAPLLVNALEQMAATVCPLCAIASGKVTTEDAGVDFATSPVEMNGEHRIYSKECGYGTTPCRAASIHADIRVLIAEDLGALNLKGAQ